VTRRRLDAELVRRGLYTGRAAAREAVEAGVVQVAGTVVTKAASMVPDDAPIVLLEATRPYVSRGGGKLAAALDRFGIDPTGLRCLDAGASTGGFTDVLLQRGAAAVIAVDVGYGQLAWPLRSDPRVEVHERTNIRTLDATAIGGPVDLVVADLSFISLRTALPSLRALATPEAPLLLLVKPQFEVGRGAVGKGGVVRDPGAWRGALEHVVEAADVLGLAACDVMASPVPGPSGNVEFLLLLRRGTVGSADIPAAVAEGVEIQP
jgi:23S rRNA (cytidine1920-2'-O)/16S rRNA (cytidine1409-2'-O)-methyltransferase